MKKVIDIIKLIIMIILIGLIILIMLEFTRAVARLIFDDADGGSIVGFIGGMSLSFIVWRILKK